MFQPLAPRSRPVLAALIVAAFVGAAGQARAADYRFTTLAGAPPGGTADGAAIDARFYFPSGVAVDGSGTVYVADKQNNTIRRISPAGVVSTVAGSARDGGSTDGYGVNARFFFPSAIAVDPSGVLYIADTYNNTIRKIAVDGQVTTLAGLAGQVCGLVNAVGADARFCRPAGIAVTSAGIVYVADTGNAVVRRIMPDGTVTTAAGDGMIGTKDGPAAEARFLVPIGIAVDPAGTTVYVVDQYAHTIRSLAGGVVSTLAGLPSTPGAQDGVGADARFHYPTGLSIDASGTLYVTDTRNQTIRAVAPGGSVTTLAGTPGVGGYVNGTGAAVRFSSPSGIAAAANGRLFVTDPNNHVIRSGVARQSNFDLDRDGRSDLTVYRPTTGEWWTRKSGTGFDAAQYDYSVWGEPGDIPVPGDYNGDGHIDFAIWRPSTGDWWIAFRNTPAPAYGIYRWGQTGDIPIPGDFDGDGRFDLVVFRPSLGIWLVSYSTRGYSSVSYGMFSWGLPGDIPLGADFDGDGLTDLTVWRPAEGNWYVSYSSTGYASFAVYQWGLPGDVPLVTEFDNDGRTELTVWRPSTGEWFTRYSTQGYSYGSYSMQQWGLPGDTPVAGDFDGDGRTDLSIWRPSNGQWWIRTSSTAYSWLSYWVYQWGLPGDTPVAIK